ncbi:MAG: hypothetical protein MJZ25_04080 [Fibrobacter sp.]|nr:hypothetical protein [Fibrobacter sp.]
MTVNVNGNKQKQAGPAVFDSNGHQTVASMKYDRIDPEYLTSLIMEHKDNVAKHGKGYPVSNELATAIQIVIKKTAGMPSWRKYTDDWKEEMYARAQYLTLKYVHNFDPVKLAKISKNNDPYYYLGMIVTRAFTQELNTLKKRSQYIQFTSLNENILHTCLSIDEYAGVVCRENERKKAETSADVALEHNTIDSAIETLDAIDAADTENLK